MNDFVIDKELKIRTTGRDDYKADDYHHPYEPTPYAVLHRLALSGYITHENILVDYGCGKGRVGCYLSARLGCKSVGIEYDRRIYDAAQSNLGTFAGKKKPEFICISAENYRVEMADCFYFFNPFAVEILQSVMGRILESYYTNPRQMTLFFYYPDDAYVAYLMTNDNLMFVDEIDCRDLFEGENHRERILIFEVLG